MIKTSITYIVANKHGQVEAICNTLNEALASVWELYYKDYCLGRSLENPMFDYGYTVEKEIKTFEIARRTIKPRRYGSYYKIEHAENCCLALAEENQDY